MTQFFLFDIKYIEEAGMEEILEIQNVGKKYQHKDGELIAMKEVNLTVKKGEFVSIIGPSRMRKINTFIHNIRIGIKI